MNQSGLCAAWLFENHRQFAARAAYAQKQIERLPEIIQQRKDEAILSMSLARPEIGSLPKGSHSGSSTEHAAIYWEQNVTQDVNLMVNQLYAELRESEYYLDLYNKIITMLKRKEAWLVEAYYEQELTIGQIIAMPESPYYQYSRSTVYRHKERILHKADEVIHNHAIKMEATVLAAIWQRCTMQCWVRLSIGSCLPGDRFFWIKTGGRRWIHRCLERTINTSSKRWTTR